MRRASLQRTSLGGTPWLRAGIAALLGACTVFSFAPFYLWPLPLLMLGSFAWMLQRTPTPRACFALGYAFGFGWFVTGVSWVFVSMHRYGGMSVPLAMFATGFFCAYLALFPAVAAWLAGRLGAGAAGRLLVAFPAAWVLGEWVRGWMFTGFPWLIVGYAQSPAGPLSGYAPLFGVYGVSLATALSAGLLALAVNRGHARTWPALAGLLALWLPALASQHWQWTHAAGEPVSVTLAQGNIDQDLKWRPEQLRDTLQTYLELTHASSSRLILLPETAVPVLDVDVPPGYFELLAKHARANGGDLLVGVPEYVAGTAPRYYNSVISLGSAPTQSYRKHHLVPFGDYFPDWAFITWIMQRMNIPMSSFSRGHAVQQPLAVAGQQVAVNICYEDAFGEEIIRQLPRATMLANFTNDAWWGDSWASEQHLQMAQTRAQETGRWMLRATNTGVTAMIDERGRVRAAAPEFETTAVHGSARGFAGATPYVRWGNWPVLALACAMLAAVSRRTRELHLQSRK
ncbi:MAG: apolipoprotein N-acyltransferase [Burkholderiales bacterium]|nr:apolipoprotein N-acyltransferase [Burkholderiales bacterium]